MILSSSFTLNSTKEIVPNVSVIFSICNSGWGYPWGSLPATVSNFYSKEQDRISVTQRIGLRNARTGHVGSGCKDLGCEVGSPGGDKSVDIYCHSDGGYQDHLYSHHFHYFKSFGKFSLCIFQIPLQSKADVTVHSYPFTTMRSVFNSLVSFATKAIWLALIFDKLFSN